MTISNAFNETMKQRREAIENRYSETPTPFAEYLMHTFMTKQDLWDFNIDRIEKSLVKLNDDIQDE